MRHNKAGNRLGRTTAHREAMLRNMVTSLFMHGRIKTTDAKAKEIRRWADQMVTLAKRGDLHARRQALAVMRDVQTVHKLFEEAAERFGPRAGGYTRIIKISTRKGDAASMSLVELVGDEKKPKEKKRTWLGKGKKAKEAKKEAPAQEPAPETAPAEQAVQEAAPAEPAPEPAPAQEPAPEAKEEPAKE